MQITQIGVMPIRGLSMDEPEYEQDIRTKSKPKPTLTDGNVAFPFARFSGKVASRKMKGILTRRRDNNADATVVHLQSLVGQPTDIIGIYAMPLPCDIEAIWLHARGRIERVKADTNTFGDINVSIEVTIEGAWKVLNRLLWEYADYDESELVVEATPVSPDISLINPYPTWEGYLHERNGVELYYWRRRESHTELMYDPDYWGLVVQFLPNGFPDIGENNNWNNNTDLQNLLVDAGLWNHRPLVVWAFKNLNAIYNITFNFIRSSRSGGSETVIFDTAQLDTILLAKTGLALQSTDIVLLGDIEGSAFVIRGGEIVAYCSSAIGAYDGEVVGDIPIGEHMQFSIVYNQLSGTQWANLLQWRRAT